MGLGHSPSIVMDGLIVSIDAGNLRSYSGSGSSAFGLVGGIGGTLVNGVGFTSTNNGSFIFDGTNDIINVPGIDINGSFTIGIYFLGTNNTTTNIIVGKYAGGSTDFWLGTTNSGGPYKIWFSVTNGSNPSKIESKSSTISTGVFYYATAVYDSSTFTASFISNSPILVVSSLVSSLIYGFLSFIIQGSKARKAVNLDNTLLSKLLSTILQLCSFVFKFILSKRLISLDFHN